MDRELRIAVADDEPVMQMYLEEMLTEFGHRVVAVARDGRELVDQCRIGRPDLVITDIKMPRMDGVAAAREIYRSGPVPLIFVTGYSAPDSVGSTADFILAYLVKPVGEPELRAAIDTVMERFEEFAALTRETGDASEALDAWRLSRRVKERLAETEGLSEAQAAEYVRALARDGGERVVDVLRRLAKQG